MLLAVCLLVTCQAHCSVVIASNPLVFPAGQQEVIVSLRNEGSQPSWVQAWIDGGQAQTDDRHPSLPLRLTPSLSRLEPGQGLRLRVFHDGAAMPVDRETLYWLNLLDMSTRDGGNVPKRCQRSRIKLLYRPSGLPASADDAHQALVWRVRSRNGHPLLQAQNPGPYVVNLVAVAIRRKEGQLIGRALHVLPFSKQRFALEGLDSELPANAQVEYSYIDDRGVERGATATLQQ
ncbi:molecular chaperone [Pseudomonas sp. UFMG81]|uniref:fimbrial biogenesis chaperone n=1 Tax=Pseudomonas sp. UFMG81 TaxID=2745936 RepID=UPI00188E467A|nr:molecular chaperone [Pseudomonas sp. UFMG81]